MLPPFPPPAAMLKSDSVVRSGVGAEPKANPKQPKAKCRKETDSLSRAKVPMRYWRTVMGYDRKKRNICFLGAFLPRAFGAFGAEGAGAHRPDVRMSSQRKTMAGAHGAMGVITGVVAKRRRRVCLRCWVWVRSVHTP